MAGQFTSANRIVAFKNETTQGTYSAPLATDYDIEFFDVGSLSFETSAARMGKPALGKMVQAQSKSGQIFATGFSVKTPLRHSGSASVAPAIAKMLEVVGLHQITDVGKIGFQYDGVQPCKTLSVIVSELNCGSTPAAVQSKGRGASANLVINGAGVGQELDLTFEVSCAYEDEDDSATPIKALQGLDDGPTEKLLGTAFTIGGQAFILHNFSLNMNNEVSKIDDPSKSGGIYQFKVKNMDPVLTCSVQMIDLTTSGLREDVINDITFDNIAISGQYWDIVIEEGNIRKNTKGEADSIITNELEIEIRKFKIVQKVIDEPSSESSESSDSSEA